MPYLEFEVDRESAARFGMTTMGVNQVIETAVGGMNLTQTVEGRERYPIRVRYQRDLRERIDDLPRLPVVTESGEVVPLEVLAKVKTTWGPGMISSEDARLVAHIAFAHWEWPVTWKPSRQWKASSGKLKRTALSNCLLV